MTPPAPRPRPAQTACPAPGRLRLAVPGGAWTVLLLAALGLSVLWIAARATTSSTPNQATAGESMASPRIHHPVTLRQPIQQPRVDTGTLDDHGRPITVACGSCHSTTQPRLETHRGEDLDEFHQGLQYHHGSLSCLSCHNAANYDQLRLADGRGLPFTEAIHLCAQCHGPQYRDYRHGSHGGMTGYWDLGKGPRQRNHCVDCHDPHAPQFPVVLPAFPLPRDRGYHPSPSH